MNENEIKAKRYLEWLNNNYDFQKSKLRAFCNDKNYEFDEDIFCQTYLKIYDKIIKSGIVDDSDDGFDSYTFMAFKQNLQREKQYSRNAKRDSNIIDLSGAYERYSSTLISEQEKLINDLRKDFFTLYLMAKAEEHFDNEHFYLFRLKTFNKSMTYQKLQEKTGIKGCRQKVVAVKNWLRENITKDELEKAFEETYGDIFQN